MSLVENLKQKGFIITSEIFTPLGTETREIFDRMDRIKNDIEALGIPEITIEGWVTETIRAGRILKDQQLEPILLINCREKSRIDIQEFLLQAFEAGIENILTFVEDYRITGDSLQELMFFHVDKGKFFSVVEHLKNGRDITGKALPQKHPICIGAGVDASWGSEIPKTALKEMEELAELGTQYFLTTPVFDLDLFEQFMKKIAPIQVPVVAEVLLIRSLEVGLFLNGHVKAGRIPVPYLEKLTKASDSEKAVKEMMHQLINGLRNLCEGIHFVPVESEEQISKHLGDKKF